MNEEIKEKLDLNPNNMNEIAKEAYYQLENYTFTLEKIQNNWNELKKGLQSLFEFDYGVISKDYLECAEDTLEKMQELEGNNE